MTYKCVLCKKKFVGQGNNAQPLKEGVCCNQCNLDVIEERLKIAKKEKK